MSNYRYRKNPQKYRDIIFFQYRTPLVLTHFALDMAVIFAAWRKRRREWLLVVEERFFFSHTHIHLFGMPEEDIIQTYNLLVCDRTLICGVLDRLRWSLWKLSGCVCVL